MKRKKLAKLMPNVRCTSSRTSPNKASSSSESSSLSLYSGLGDKIGDEILKVDGQPVSRFMSGTDGVKWRIIRSEGATIPFEVRRGNEILTFESGWTKPETSSWRGSVFEGLPERARLDLQFYSPSSPALLIARRENRLPAKIRG